jgi:hypothetical protein
VYENLEGRNRVEDIGEGPMEWDTIGIVCKEIGFEDIDQFYPKKKRFSCEH